MFKYTLKVSGKYIQVRDQLLKVAKASFSLESQGDKYFATSDSKDAFPKTLVASVEEIKEEAPAEATAEQA